MMPLPHVDKTSRRVLILTLLPEMFGSTGQVILARRHHQQRRRLRNRQRLIKKLEIFGKRVVPAASLPRDGPAFTLISANNSFDNHARFFNRPFTHRLSASSVFGDDRLQHNETQLLFTVATYL